MPVVYKEIIPTFLGIFATEQRQKLFQPENQQKSLSDFEKCERLVKASLMVMNLRFRNSQDQAKRT